VNLVSVAAAENRPHRDGEQAAGRCSRPVGKVAPGVLYPLGGARAAATPSQGRGAMALATNSRIAWRNQRQAALHLRRANHRHRHRQYRFDQPPAGFNALTNAISTGAFASLAPGAKSGVVVSHNAMELKLRSALGVMVVSLENMTGEGALSQALLLSVASQPHSH